MHGDGASTVVFDKLAMQTQSKDTPKRNCFGSTVDKEMSAYLLVSASLNYRDRAEYEASKWRVAVKICM